jgi:phosphatidylinositol alpha-1,6-mannosyltransferase
MKSLLVAYDFPPMGGGIARALGELAKPEVLGPVAVSSGVRGLPPERLKTLAGTIAWARAAERVAVAQGIDFTWAGNLKPAGYVARWLRYRRGIPYGLLLYGHDLLRVRVQARRSLRKRLAARALLDGASALVGISGWTGDLCRAVLKEVGAARDSDRLHVIPLGTDPERFTPTGPIADVGPGRWLLTVARLVPHKGVDLAIEALARLGARYEDVGYLVVGEGPDRARLEALARERGVAGRVHFLSAVPDEQLARYYRAATLYLGLSREQGEEAEGFGLSMVEAQGCGVPVLAGRSGGTADALRDGVTGWLVDAADVDALVPRLQALLDATDQLGAAGAAGRHLVETRLNWSRVGRELRSVMQACAGR